MNKLYLVFILLLFYIDGNDTAFCGTNSVPFRLEVLESGDFVLGCATPECLCNGNGGGDAQFTPNNFGEDGFLRDGSGTRSTCQINGFDTTVRCSGSFTSASCGGSNSWVGGMIDNRDGTVGLQCCSYDGMRFSAEVGRPIVHQGEVYSGGEVIRDGRQTGFDLISNVRKINAQDGSLAYELTIHRMNCIPNPPEDNDVDFDSNTEITKILDKVVDQPPQLEAPQTNDQVVQIGEAAVPVQTPGYYYPVAGVPACFTADTIVVTKDGSKSIDQLNVGEYIQVSVGNSTTYDEVISFIHRLPDISANFVRLQLIDGTEVKLTPQHFIHKIDCKINPSMDNVKLIYAVEVSVGDCLLKQNNEGHFIPMQVATISTIEEKGVYSPMTESGTIVVNNVMASCHNVIKSETLTNTFFKAILKFERTIKNLFTYMNGDKKEAHLPFGVDFIFKALHHFIPESTFEIYKQEL